MTMHGAVKSFVERLSFAINSSCRLVHLLTIPPALRSETHGRPCEAGRKWSGDSPAAYPPKSGRRHPSQILPQALEERVAHFPSADFARYSTSANNDGSTQMPWWAVFLA
jgi:hypothetical protein